jgi:hypothetical protein
MSDEVSVNGIEVQEPMGALEVQFGRKSPQATRRSQQSVAHIVPSVMGMWLEWRCRLRKCKY